MSGNIAKFQKCLNLLRDEESITGVDASQEISLALCLRLMNDHLEQLELEKYHFTFEDQFETEEGSKNHKSTLLKVTKFSELLKETEGNILNITRELWKDVLSDHPILSKIFHSDKSFKIKKGQSFKDFLTIISTIKIDNGHYDILGQQYEEIYKDLMIGKVLGQYYTPLEVRKFMVELINPQLGETIFDPAMGSGGFLKSFSQFLKHNNPSLDLKTLKDYIYGCDSHEDTYFNSVRNQFISTGEIMENLRHADSIRQVIYNKKFDICLANPPFGVKGIKYENISNPLKEKIIPIESSNSTLLFIQLIIYYLKIGGRCAVVLPDGKEIFAKSGDCSMTREYLLRTCNLEEVVCLPADIFTNTSIKTCVFKFSKKAEGEDILTIKQNKKKKSYSFTEDFQTQSVKFYSYNPKENSKEFIVDVPIQKIAKNSFSLNYNEYMDKKEENFVNNQVEFKTLGEVCKFDIGATPSRSKEEYYENGNNLWISVRELNGGYIYDTKEKITDLGVKNSSVKLFKKDTVLFSFKLSIGKTAIVGNPLYSNEAIAGIISKDNNILNNKYLYYYLTNTDFTKTGTGLLGNGSLNKSSLGQLKIPIPPLETQKTIVEYCENNDNLIKKLEKEIENNKQLSKDFLNMVLNSENSVENVEENEEVEQKVEDIEEVRLYLKESNLIEKSLEELKEFCVENDIKEDEVEKEQLLKIIQKHFEEKDKLIKQSKNNKSLSKSPKDDKKTPEKSTKNKKSPEKEKSKKETTIHEKLNSKTVDDIKEFCKTNNIKGYSKKNKKDLIEFVVSKANPTNIESFLNS